MGSNNALLPTNHLTNNGTSYQQQPFQSNDYRNIVSSNSHSNEIEYTYEDQHVQQQQQQHGGDDFYVFDESSQRNTPCTPSLPSTENSWHANNNNQHIGYYDDYSMINNQHTIINTNQLHSMSPRSMRQPPS